MPRRRSKKPNKASGIAHAALEGAREGATKEPEAPARDAKTVNPDAVGFGGQVAFPAPSAQPVKSPETERPAKVDVGWVEDEDDDSEWRRAGGGPEAKK